MDIKNPFLQTYLEYVEDTETPRIMHIWSALTGAGACLGRRVYFPFGSSPIYCNLYTLLVGPPGARKSTAIKITEKLIRETTRVRFTPDDTSGKRQGLITAMENKDESELDEKELDAAIAAADIDAVGKMETHIIDPRDEHVVFACASEFATFIGQNSLDMINFLNKVYDGENYDYQIKSSKMTLNKPLLTILGGITTVLIQDTLPPSAIGHGFTSRIILVYDNKKYKKVPRMKHLPEKQRGELLEIFGWLSKVADGPIEESKSAGELIDDLYDVDIRLDDSRFVYYAQRRQNHLIKLATILAACRKSRKVEIQDIEEAQGLLELTEERMPEALGEYGMSKVSAAKQKMLELIQHISMQGKPINNLTLWSFMSRDMTLSEYKNSLAELINSDKIVQVHTNDGEAFVYKEKESSAQLFHLVKGGKNAAAE